MVYNDVSQSRGVSIVFNYVHILCGGFPHISDVRPIFLFNVVGDDSKVLCILHYVLYRVPCLLAIR
jgi:hypothetical protein